MILLSEVGPALPAVARRAISDFTSKREPLTVHAAGPEAPVFVTLRRTDGSLRGCVGALRPVEADVARETARCAVLAASRDPRFGPVGADELPDLGIEVSILSPEELVRDEVELDPAKYGVIVRDGGGRQALLLPSIPGIEDVRTQLALVRRKAGIPEGAPANVTRFRVDRWRE